MILELVKRLDELMEMSQLKAQLDALQGITTPGEVFNPRDCAAYPKFAFKQDTCSICGQTEGQLKNCGRCGVKKYCSAECQKMDWPRHKDQCTPRASC